MKTLVIICGPGAVGKMAVGQALSALTGLPLFHNHLSIEAVLPVFDFAAPQFERLVTGFRRAVFEEVATSDLPGLIFTFVWAFDQPTEVAYLRDIAASFVDRGHRLVFVELYADQATRLRRNESASRLAEKPSKRDVERSRATLLQHDREYQLNSKGDFPLPEHLFIDNTNVSAEDAAQRIAAHFGLPTRD
jgi:hypothetical protein